MNEMVSREQAASTGGPDRERGATALEYALMVALLAVVIVGAVSAFGSSLPAQITTVKNVITPSATAEP